MAQQEGNRKLNIIPSLFKDLRHERTEAKLKVTEIKGTDCILKKKMEKNPHNVPH